MKKTKIGKKRTEQKFGLYQNFIYVYKCESTIEKWLRKNGYIE